MTVYVNECVPSSVCMDVEVIRVVKGSTGAHELLTLSLRLSASVRCRLRPHRDLRPLTTCLPRIRRRV